MAKKSNKTTKTNGNEHIVESVNSNITSTDTNQDINPNDYQFNSTFTETRCEISYVSLQANSKPLSEMNIMELISLETACNLLCRRFETVAQLDYNNNFKFKEYQRYYEMIFSELERRVVESCKNV